MKDLASGESYNITTGVVHGHIGTPSYSNGMVTFRAYDYTNNIQNYYVWTKETGVQLITSSDPGAYSPVWGYPPSYGSIEPTINNGKVAVALWDGSDYEIHTWDDGTWTQITDNDYDDYEPQIHGERLSWTGWGGDETTKEDVYYYDGQDIHNISQMHAGKDEDSFIDENQVTFISRAYEYGDPLWDVVVVNTDTLDAPQTVLHLEGNDFEPMVRDGIFGWHSRKDLYGSDFYAYYYDGYKLDKFDVGNESELNPYIYGGSVLFESYDGNDFEIYKATYIKDEYTPFAGKTLSVQADDSGVYFAQGSLGVGMLRENGSERDFSYVQFADDVYDIEKAGDYIYAAARTDGLKTLTVGADNNLHVVASTSIEGSLSAISRRGSLLAVGAKEGGLALVDISNPAEPTVVRSVELPGHTYGSAFYGDYLYVANAFKGYSIVDISDVANAFVAGGDELAGYIWDITISEDFAVMVSPGAGLKLYSLEDPLLPSMLSELELPTEEGGWDTPLEVVIRDNILFAAAGSSGVFAINIDDLENPYIIERYDTLGFAFGVSITGQDMYIADYDNGFSEIDVSDHVSATPLPGSLGLLFTGLGGFIFSHYRRRGGVINES